MEALKLLGWVYFHSCSTWLTPKQKDKTLYSPSRLVLFSYAWNQEKNSSISWIRLIHVTNSWADVHKSLDGEMLPLHSGILAKVISIASSSLQQIQSISLALLLQCPHFRSNHPELFCKKVVLKNFARFIVVSADTGVSCEFYVILKNTFFSQNTSSGCF